MPYVLDINTGKPKFYQRLNDTPSFGGIKTKNNDGVEYLNTYWDDLRFPFMGQQLDTASGRIDYSYSELGIGFQNNTRYTEEPICMIVQMPHAWKLESAVHPHLHFIQNQNASPNWMIEYRVYKNGAAVPSTWQKSIGSLVYSYTSGSIIQKCIFTEIDMTGIDSVSSFIDVKLYRDTGNASSLFTGSDPYTGTAIAKEFDIHYEIDMPGSRDQYIK